MFAPIFTWLGYLDPVFFLQPRWNSGYSEIKESKYISTKYVHTLAKLLYHFQILCSI